MAAWCAFCCRRKIKRGGRFVVVVVLLVSRAVHVDRQTVSSGQCGHHTNDVERTSRSYLAFKSLRSVFPWSFGEVSSFVGPSGGRVVFLWRQIRN